MLAFSATEPQILRQQKHEQCPASISATNSPYMSVNKSESSFIFRLIEQGNLLGRQGLEPVQNPNRQNI